MTATLPRRRPLRYFGSKWNLVPWIISHFLPHHHYVDPFFGGGAILFRKQPVKLETVNDLNGRVTNYFQVLRDRPAELIQAIELTPWSKQEYQDNQTPAKAPIEDTRRFHATCWMSIHAGPCWTGFRNQKSVANRFTAPPDDLIRHDLWNVAQRLREVQILNMDALELLESYAGRDDPFIYLDPPYVTSTLRANMRYGELTQDNSFHRRLAETVRGLSCPVVLSGYKSELYQELYEEHGWRWLNYEKACDGAGQFRTECIWLNPPAMARTQKRLL